MKDKDKEEEQRSRLQGTMAMGPRASVTCQRYLELQWNLTPKTVSPLLQFHTLGLSLFGCCSGVNRHSNKVRCLAVLPGIILRWSQNYMKHQHDFHPDSDSAMSHCVGSCVKGRFVCFPDYQAICQTATFMSSKDTQLNWSWLRSRSETIWVNPEP